MVLLVASILICKLLLLLLIADGECILNLVPNHMVLKHHLLLGFVHEEELILLSYSTSSSTLCDCILLPM